ncbi:YjiH family protein [Alteribacillus bidgolensis]|uniref:Nucleoside recognition GATE domain-containing membrane protein YjiH n=1 Tax=Alteribacillus bidgolensis TaxID=930129 RepID=A0A1G8KDT2_9BACI|nr:YjiH family protein [Alteribacillus bidgolensis]SDI41584.1 nucleoside recognition GATE domain-containing membrane protein YjiH [Alteribacillus bidgolensis]
MGIEKPKEKHNKVYSMRNILQCVIPSLAGIILFMVPIGVEGEITIPVAYLADRLTTLLETAIPFIVVSLLFITTAGAILRPKFLVHTPFLRALFYISPTWVVIRAVGLVYGVLTLFKVGPEMVWSVNTGGLLFYDLIPLLFSIFLFAGLFLPLLLNYGLLEFSGTLLKKVMRPVFTLPGRSSIDCITSWLGDGTIGVLLTSKQYEEGYYSQREATVIGTTFSVVSITFTIVVLSYMELDQYFFQYYATIFLTGFILAIVLPRIPPLSLKSKRYADGKENHGEKDFVSYGPSLLKRGFYQAVKRASDSNSVSAFLKNGAKNVMEMWLGVLPVVMAIGTTALVIAEYTPMFEYLGMPLIPILNVMQIPEAAEAAQTLVIGFADMLLPAIIGSGIESELTKFVIACISVTQLVYLSEVGGLLLASKIPIRFLDLVLIFFERTLIGLPIIVAAAHIIF